MKASSPSFSDTEKTMHSVLRTMHEPRVSQLHADEVSSLLVEECAKLKARFFEENWISDLHVIDTGVICTTGDLSRIRLQKLMDRFRAERLMRVRLMNMLLDTCQYQLQPKPEPEMVDASTLTSCSAINEDPQPVKMMLVCFQRGRKALSRIFSKCRKPE